MKKIFLYMAPVMMMLLAADCAYFNAFYLAKKNYKDGERHRRNNNGEVEQQAKKSYTEAVKWAREVLSEYPDSRYVDDSLFIIGMSRYYQQDYVVARTQFDEILNRFPESDYADEAGFYRARCYIELGQFENAQMALNDVLGSDDRSLKGRAGLALAEIALLSESWEELLNGAQAVIDSDPEEKEYAQAVYYKGEALFNLDRYEDCITALAALNDRKIDTDLRFKVNSRLAQSKARLGKYDEGLSHLSSLQSRGEFESYAPRIRYEMGYIQELRGETELAIDTYKKMAADYPDSLPSKRAWFRVGEILIDNLANADQARDAYKNVGEPIRNSKDSCFVVAKIKIAWIDTMQARLDRIEKITDDPDLRTKTRFSLAELYYYSFQRPDSAMTQYRIIMEESPESEYTVMSDFYLSRHEMETAGNLTEDNEHKLIDRIIDTYPDSEFAGKLRSYIGAEDTTPHVVALKRAEEAMFSGKSWEEYIPLYQAVVDEYPGTRSAYKARLVLAYAYEHDAGDSGKAIELYKELADETPNFFNEEYVQKAREKLTFYEKEPEMLAEIEKYIADFEAMQEQTAAEVAAIADGTAAGETQTSTDSDYTGLRRIRARNARIRSRYYTY